MTEQEAEIKRVINYIRSCRNVGIDTTITIDKSKSHFILNALEEIQQYRALGTPEQLKVMKESALSSLELANICAALEQLKKYEAIGTLEELREAREKQVPKKPILSMNEQSGMFVDYADGHGEYKVQTNNWWRCPYCNSVVGQRVIVHKHVHDQRKKKYCEDCGQAISWE
uniref:C2H2-type domain-containing protein n=1 Tax=Dulem virus 39 TaxID=3145757 RepID=A0AAU8B5C9_9CAUD